MPPRSSRPDLPLQLFYRLVLAGRTRVFFSEIADLTTTGSTTREGRMGGSSCIVASFYSEPPEPIVIHRLLLMAFYYADVHNNIEKGTGHLRRSPLPHARENPCVNAADMCYEGSMVSCVGRKAAQASW